MPEWLPMQYREVFGELFSLLQFEGKQEIEVIYILYACATKCLSHSPDHRKLPKPMNLIKIVPEAFDYLDSDLKKDGFGIRQHLE